MSEQTQTITVEQIEGVPGNCLQAAVASLLNLPIEAVPHFVLFDHWADALERWLEDSDLGWYRYGSGVHIDGPHLLYGHSPRGFGHTVVRWKDGTIWDPHPSRDGLVSVDEVWAIRHIDGSLPHTEPETRPDTQDSERTTR